MPALEITRRWTAREVRQLIADDPEVYGPRYELIDGDLVVTPSPGYRHQVALRELEFALIQHLHAHPIGSVLRSPSDVELEPESVRQPDLFVVPLREAERLAREDFPAHELILAVEVLSPSTAHVDRVRKRELYQRHAHEYWIVDTDARVVERWRADDDKPEVMSSQLTWQPAGATQRLVVDLEALFATCWGER